MVTCIESFLLVMDYRKTTRVTGELCTESCRELENNRNSRIVSNEFFSSLLPHLTSKCESTRCPSKQTPQADPVTLPLFPPFSPLLSPLLFSLCSAS